MKGTMKSKTSNYVTNVGLITSNGKYGNNIMAAEWTYKISSDPYLIQLCIGYDSATLANIMNNKVFGVSLSATDQNIITSISGNCSGKEIDKIGLLKELGVAFFKAKTIDVLMVKNAAMNAECKVKDILEIGDHSLVIGEVQTSIINNAEPLAYHNKSFWQIGSNIRKPGDDVLIKIDQLKQKYQSRLETDNR